MKQIIILLVLVLTFSIFGCSSGGGSSSVSTLTAPAVVSISPLTGGPGTTVTIMGSRFGAFQGTSLVTYSGINADLVSWSDTMIVVKVPANAQANGTFQVIVNGQVSNYSTSFTVSNPIISYLSPQTGIAGTQVTISGQYFGARSDRSYVSFNAQNAGIISWSDTSIVCTVPSTLGSQSGSISVVVVVDGNKSSNIASFNYSSPAINSVSPTNDNIGATVSIIGQGFGLNQSSVNGYVTLGGQTAQILSWNDSLIQFRVPQVSTSGTSNLLVYANGQSINNSFTVEAPIAYSQSPTQVGYNETLTISGNYFGQSTDQVSRSIQIENHGQVAGEVYSDTSLSFTWPVSNALIGNQTRTVTINIGGLTTTISITAD
jgi:hypothetical protein